MKHRRVPGGFFVVLDKGEEIVATLTAFAREQKIEGGGLAAIGALEDPTLGFYDLGTKTYDQSLFKGEFELVALNGNISLVDGEPFVHCHATLGKPDYSLIGGHLFSGTVAVTAEVHVRVFDEAMKREKNAAIGLNLLAL
jgi:predicted DNA-binding protein with PD1-like motif